MAGFKTVMTAAAGLGLVAGQPLAADPGDVPAVDLPELAQPGTFAVGTRTMEVAIANRAALDASALTGGAPVTGTRAVRVRLWYPATPGDAPRAHYSHSMAMPGTIPFTLEDAGRAYDGAPVVESGRYPLVVMSHGFSGWAEQYSRLGEHIASRGYIVASIDHGDARFDDVPGFLLSFGNVLLSRAADQRDVLGALVAQSAAGDTVLGQVDRNRIGLIGYSMGGFGALATAGGDYGPAAPAFANLPQSARAALPASDAAVAAQIDALVLIAPWGGQPGSRAWSNEALAGVSAPMLIIAGNRDDVVDYDGGVRWLFDGLRGSDRHLLVYREARHNVVGNAFDLPPEAGFQAAEFLSEPVWRMDRINAINQHFITAFLDARLKGDIAHGAYLSVPAPDAADADWPSQFGQQWGGTVAGDAQPGYWRGFQRRWAVGLELHKRGRGE